MKVLCRVPRHAAAGNDSAVLFRNMCWLVIAIAQGFDIARQRHLKKIGRDRAAHTDLEAGFGIVVLEVIKVRIAIGGRIGVNAHARGQGLDAAARVLQCVEVDLGAGQGADAAGQAEGPASFQHIGDDVAEGVDALR